MNRLALEIGDLINNAATEFLQNLVGKILESTEVLQVRRYGPHVVTTYKDGRKIVHTATCYPSEIVYGPTPYEMLQLGEEMPILYRPSVSPWAVAALTMPLAVAGWAAARFGGAER